MNTESELIVATLESMKDLIGLLKVKLEQLESDNEDLQHALTDLEERFDNTENDLTRAVKNNEENIVKLAINKIELESEVECCMCGGHSENGLVEIEKDNDVMMCEDCDIDGENYNGWDDDNEHCPNCYCISKGNKPCKEECI